MSSFSTSKCVGHVTSANSWGLEAISKHHLTAPLPASPSNRTAALEAASSHVALSPEECLPGWEEKEEGVSRQVSLSHPGKAVEETEEPFVPHVA